jgi:hypothetical protein
MSLLRTLSNAERAGGMAALQNPALDVLTAKLASLRFSSPTPGMMNCVVPRHEELVAGVGVPVAINTSCSLRT